ncbi:DUF3667 domain-containing protein [Aquimarina pacifica]|uniref:DUF3667 domain-containing protein n=1 Tax=Aquimarina pacifica TaxID=1296415 RepID=UPI000470BB43|nr:DUF3667 domain-containing protein [Aquimarina pacifica]
MNKPIVVTSCKNCKQNIENYIFCPKCGAKKITNRITFSYLILEFTNRFLNLDNSFLKTFLHLFTKPEEVIKGYINGLRKRYINAFGYFAISVTITGFYSFIMKGRMLELIALNSTSEEQLSFSQASTDFSYQYQSLISILIIPLLALISRLVFINFKKYNLTEHFVIYLYAYSHIVMSTSFLLMPLAFITDNIYISILVSFPIYILYISYVLKRIYDISVKRIVLKALLCLLIVFFVFILIVCGIVVLIKTGIISVPAVS